MPELRVPLDPCNPGQFYACCGLIELFDLDGAQALSHFVLDPRHPRQATFVLASESPLDLATVTKALRTAKYDISSRPGAPTDKSDAIAPAMVSMLGRQWILDWWLDRFYEKASWLKCWAGQVTTQKLFSTLPTLISVGRTCFEEGILSTSRFGVDPRSAWVALDLGYSPNEQNQDARTFPLVEMLAAFGLQGFRPSPQGKRSDGFTYSLWLSGLPRAAARSACARPWDGLASATYHFVLGGRGSYKYFSFAEPFNLG